jgi:hypothetical protein
MQSGVLGLLFDEEGEKCDGEKSVHTMEGAGAGEVF